MEKIVSVRVTTNSIRTTKSVSNTKTIKEVLELAGAKFDRAQVSIDGAVLTASELNQPISTFTNADECFISALAKMDNAA